MQVVSGLRAALIAAIAVLVFIPASASAAKKGDTVTVCKSGCDYKKVQKAVNKTGKNDTIKVKPGTYKEAVLVEGKKHNNLTIKGTKKSKVIFNGKGNLNNGIEGIDVKGLELLKFTVKNYAANGVFLHECSDYLMKNLIASYNRSYGLFAFDCKGGRITKSVGYGHGDSAFYIGATPFQDNPKTTSLDNLDAYLNVLGYSGTNSKYVDIHDSNFYNNGVGLVPNTLDSEPYEPSADSRIHDNNIFWNNLNYFLPESPVKTVSNGLGEIGDATINYPTGVGIVLFGSDGWVVENNEIFGNFKWGSAAFSDPFNCEGPAGSDCTPGDDAISRNNQFLNNSNGRLDTDPNAVDFFVDGSGSGNCFQGNSSSTFQPSGPGGASIASLYPSCPAPAPPASGTGTPFGDPDLQLNQLLGYVAANPPETMQCSWDEHTHPPFQDFEPYNVPGFDPSTC